MKLSSNFLFGKVTLVGFEVYNSTSFHLLFTSFHDVMVEVLALCTTLLSRATNYGASGRESPFPCSLSGIVFINPLS